MVCFLLDERHFLFGFGEKGIIYAIQHGGRIDRQTGRIIKQGDKENEKENEKEKSLQLTDRQKRIISIIKVDDKVTAKEIKQHFKESLTTINRDITVLKEKDALTREGGDKGGRWIILI